MSKDPLDSRHRHALSRGTVRVPRKTILVAVGCFRELGYDSRVAPSLAEARGKRPAANKDRVVRYLRSGNWFSYAPGIVKDCFAPSIVIGTPGVQTDGVHLWPEVLPYYIERYDIELPAFFEDFMEARDWQVPADIDLWNLSLPARPS